MANAGAVLSMLDGPQGCDLAYCVVWFLASYDEGVSCLSTLDKFTACWVWFGMGALGMVLFIHLLLVLLVLVLCGTPLPPTPPPSHMPGWARPGLPGLRSLVGLGQHYRSAILDA